MLRTNSKKAMKLFDYHNNTVWERPFSWVWMLPFPVYRTQSGGKQSRICVFQITHISLTDTVVQYIKIKFLFYHTFLTIILIVIIIHSMSSKRSNYFSKTLRNSFSREDISDLSPNRIDSSFILWSLYLIHSLIIKLLVSFWNLPLSVSLYSNTY